MALILGLILTACSSKTLEHDPEVLMANALATCPDCPASGYSPADGFVVHEWGTLTSVVGSDGVPLPGLHHEEEDLPGFVADRVAQVDAYPHSNTFLKMETPVAYFYAPEPLTAWVNVSFANGLLTQWFPWVKRVAPPVFDRNGVVVDAWLSSSMSKAIPASCAEHFNSPFSSAYSSLDWGEVQVLSRSARPSLAGPIGDAAWGFARNVASNPLAVKAPDDASTQYEQFLFYRGLGESPLPVVVTSQAVRCSPDLVTFTNTGAQPVGKVLLMQVTATGAAFVEVGDVGSSPVEARVPDLLMPLPEFVSTLKARLMMNLVADGLYADEAKAMVDTWERSYFLTPGVRALYLLPQAQTEQIIPLSVTPQPRVTKRTMVIRVEVLGPTEEAALSVALTDLASPAQAAAGRDFFLARGRFAEPHLTRAIALSNVEAERVAGEALLRQIRGTQRWAPVTAE